MSDLQEWHQGCPAACRAGMKAAAAKPGRYGGRYIARRYNLKTGKTQWLVLDDDDPELPVDDTIDICAIARPTEIIPLGRARNWLRADGSVAFQDKGSDA